MEESETVGINDKPPETGSRLILLMTSGISEDFFVVPFYFQSALVH